ncbi:tetratricopeptide repeat protein [Candidatus Woesearchaeota archaeon]|nr:tetratricopeptide repeat protein [Candidatus Woesearchaeota archaeon]
MTLVDRLRSIAETVSSFPSKKTEFVQTALQSFVDYCEGQAEKVEGGAYRLDSEPVFSDEQIRYFRQESCLDVYRKIEEMRRPRPVLLQNPLDQTFTRLELRLAEDEVRETGHESEHIYRRARGNYRLGHFEDAIQDAENIIELDPKNVSAYNFRGLALRGLKKYEDALSNFEFALGIDSQDASLHHNMGLVLLDLKRFDFAKEKFDRALQLNPKLVEAHIARAAVLRNKGFYHDALLGLDEAVALDTQYEQSYFERSGVKISLGLFEEAKVDLAQAIALNPTWALPYHDLGFVRIRLGEYAEAIKVLDISLELDPFYLTFVERGFAKAKLGFVQEGLEDIDRGFSMAPSQRNIYPYLFRALINESLLPGAGFFRRFFLKREVIIDYSVALEISSNFKWRGLNRECIETELLVREGLMRFKHGANSPRVTFLREQMEQSGFEGSPGLSP